MPLPAARRVRRAKIKLETSSMILDGGVGTLRLPTDGPTVQDRLTSQPDLSDQQARGQVMTVLRAGHQPTTMALTWVLAVIDQAPAISAELEAVWDAPAVQRAQPLDDASRDYSRAQEEDLLA